jgi:transcriptional regulator of NAD metabolism
MKVIMNEKRQAIVNVLKGANEPMTLNEIAMKMGVEKIASGTTNAMLEAGIIKVAGTKRVPIVSYREVNVYEMGEMPAENEKGE